MAILHNTLKFLYHLYNTFGWILFFLIWEEIITDRHFGTNMQYLLQRGSQDIYTHEKYPKVAKFYATAFCNLSSIAISQVWPISRILVYASQMTLFMWLWKQVSMMNVKTLVFWHRYFFSWYSYIHLTNQKNQSNR